MKIKRLIITLIMAIVIETIQIYAEENQPSNWSQIPINSLKEVDFFRYAEFLRDYQEPVTRGEFAVLIVTLYETFGNEIDYNDAELYTDLGGNPYIEEIGKASGYNFVTGASYYQYQADDILTREWAATYVHRLLTKLEYKKRDNQVDVIFQDMFSISASCWQSVEYVVANGFMLGIGNQTFNPGGVLTREQAYVMMWKIYSDLL